jgi:hypothetical protein
MGPNWEGQLARFAPRNFHRARTGNAERQLPVFGSQFSVGTAMEEKSAGSKTRPHTIRRDTGRSFSYFAASAGS